MAKDYLRAALKAGIHTCAWPGRSADYRMQQSPFEVAELCRFLVKHRVKSYLEIGLGRGGTWTFLSETLDLNPTCGITFDNALKHMPPHGLLHLGGSETPEALAFAEQHGPFDFLFIDARHEHEAVIEDFARYAPLGKAIGLHDIAGLHGCPGSATSWAQIAAENEVLAEFIDPDWPIGIGVVKGGA